MAIAPEAGAIPGETAVADMGHGNPNVLSHRHFQVAKHITDAGIAGNGHALPLWEGEFGR